MKLPVLSVIIPCYNEEQCIYDTTNRLLHILEKLVKDNLISDNSFIFFVNDGSNDNTWNLIKNLNKESINKVKGLKFSKNFGNQKAILAGLLESEKYGADIFLTIDADLQQDETKIPEFIQKYNNGAQIVCGIRNDRHTDKLFYKFFALAFYKLMNFLGVNIKMNHSDFRLISLEIVKTLKNYKETNLFLRGIINDVGFKKDYVNFDVKERQYGHSKFTSFKLFELAISGITSFSLIPLRMVTVIGFIMSFLSFLLGVFSIYDKIKNFNIVPGWATIVVAISFIGGIQILCLGIMAEYLGQLFVEVKNRPRYIIEEELN